MANNWFSFLFRYKCAVVLVLFLILIILTGFAADYADSENIIFPQFNVHFYWRFAVNVLFNCTVKLSEEEIKNQNDICNF